jgi:predicted phage terminase large subunit-like protein
MTLPFPQMYDPKKVTQKLARFATSDFAVTEDSGDYTSLGVHGLDADGDLYLALDSWHGKTAPDVWIDEACNLMLRHSLECFFGESGVIRRAIEPFLVKRMQERRCFVRVEWLASIADKPARARTLQGHESMGKVWLPDNEAGHRILAPMLGFPGAKYDDDVDMVGMPGRAIEELNVINGTGKSFYSAFRRAG